MAPKQFSFFFKAVIKHNLVPEQLQDANNLIYALYYLPNPTWADKTEFSTNDSKVKN